MRSVDDRPAVEEHSLLAKRIAVVGRHPGVDRVAGDGTRSVEKLAGHTFIVRMCRAGNGYDSSDPRRDATLHIQDGRPVTSSRAQHVAARISESIDARQSMLADSELLAVVDTVVGVIVAALQAGKKVLFFGNGGSSMDAGHLAAELLGRYYLDRPALPAIALSDATAAMTAIGNDYGYADVFSRQITGLGVVGDVAVALSTSGNSENVVKAIRTANELGMATVAFTGKAGGTVAGLARHVLRVPTDDTPRVQECQMLLGHTICELVELELSASG